MRILSVVLISFCTVLLSVSTFANDDKKKKNDEVSETVIVNQPDKTVENPVKGDASGTTVNTNDAAKENVDRHDDTTSEEQAIMQQCRQILKRINANQTGTINSLNSFNRAKEHGSKEDMFFFSKQMKEQKERRDDAIAEFQQLGCDDYLDADAIGNINAPAVTQ